MSINLMVVSGNLGSDIDVRYTPNNKCIGQVSIPAKSGFGDYEKTSWISCKILGERAEKLAPYLLKGRMVTFTGEFILEEWEKDGKKNSRATMLVRDIQLPPNQDKDNSDQDKDRKGGYHQDQQSSQQLPPQNFDNYEDDIPF